jgi:hypothetical protein
MCENLRLGGHRHSGIAAGGAADVDGEGRLGGSGARALGGGGLCLLGRLQRADHVRHRRTRLMEHRDVVERLHRVGRLQHQADRVGTGGRPARVGAGGVRREPLLRGGRTCLRGGERSSLLDERRMRRRRGRARLVRSRERRVRLLGQPQQALPGHPGVGALVRLLAVQLGGVLARLLQVVPERVAGAGGRGHDQADRLHGGRHRQRGSQQTPTHARTSDPAADGSVQQSRRPLSGVSSTSCATHTHSWGHPAVAVRPGVRGERWRRHGKEVDDPLCLRPNLLYRGGLVELTPPQWSDRDQSGVGLARGVDHRAVWHRHDAEAGRVHACHARIQQP